MKNITIEIYEKPINNFYISFVFSYCEYILNVVLKRLQPISIESSLLANVSIN